MKAPISRTLSGPVAVLLLLAIGVAAFLALRPKDDPAKPAAAVSIVAEPVGGIRDAAPREASELAASWTRTIVELEKARARGADPEPAVYVSILPSAERSAAFKNLLAGLTGENGAELYQLLTAPDAPPLMDAEWTRFAEKWGGLDGPGAFGAIGDPAGQALLPDVFRGWAATNPEAAATALAGLEGADSEGDTAGPGGETWLPLAWHECVRGWKVGDLEVISRRIGEQDSAVVRDAANAALAERAVAVDPPAALARALAITDASWRQTAFDTVGRRWLELDRAVAKTALEKAGCSAETIEALQLAPEPGFDLLEQPEILSSSGNHESGIFIK